MIDPGLGDLTNTVSDLVGGRFELVEQLRGGEHARTFLGRIDDELDVVVRQFPPGDTAVDHERGVLGRLATLGASVPGLIASSTRSALGPIIVTTRVAGRHPAPTLPTSTIAVEMASALARIHELGGDGLRRVSVEPAETGSALSAAARQEFGALDEGGSVLTHYDFWCGNALWDDVALSGVIDWSGARNGPRGVDLAWCRLDLVLLGSPRAAEEFLACYERAAGVTVPGMRAWDLRAAADADSSVESWAPNYHGIGREQLTGQVLRDRFDAWSDHLLHQTERHG